MTNSRMRARRERSSPAQLPAPPGVEGDGAGQHEPCTRSCTGY